MTDEHPERLASREGPLKALIEEGRKELPTEAQLALLAAKLGPVLGGGGGAGGAGAAKTAVATTSKGGSFTALTLAKGVGLGALGAAAIATVLRVATLPAATKPPVDNETAQAPAPTTDPADPSSEPPSPLAFPLTVPIATEPPPSPPVPRDASPASPTTGASTLAELQMLQDARKAIATKPAEALSLCDQAARRFPNGVMKQEREVLAIQALLKLGRADEARTRASAFRKTYPDSSYLRRIDQILPSP